jgi:tetratricopeptide (TPR) repeat protein
MLEKIGPYALERELGAGAMGTVYAATVGARAPGLELGDEVALKVVHPQLLERSGFFRRFMREAEVGTRIRHENVVRTHLCDQLVVDGTPYAFLVMEYVEGRTLTQLRDDLGCVPEELCRHIGREMSKGLIAIHEAGIVHRDVKPDNVLVTRDHVVKLMDLGVARLEDEEVRLSRPGAFVGSPEYASPEQFEGGDVDGRCDLHAVGVVLYELACGVQPFRADSFRHVMKRICEEAPRRLGDVQPQISEFLEELVHTLLEKDRSARFESAAVLLDVLEQGEDSAWWRQRAVQRRDTVAAPARRLHLQRETSVHGRDDELDRMRELFGLAKGGQGQVVLVEGEAGVGKSRFVDELVRRLRDSGEDVEFVFGGYPPGAAATAAGGFSSAYREFLGPKGAAPYLEETPLLVPAFDAALRGETTPAGEAELSLDALGTCFVHVTRRIAAERPVVVLIDDLHFAPNEARDLFAALAQAIARSRVLLVGTVRPGAPPEWIANLVRLEHASQVELPRLGPKDLAALLEEAFGSRALAEELGYRIVTKSDGNPFFAFEIIRGLREGQFIRRNADGSWTSTNVIDDIEIPSSLLDLVNARIAHLGDEERHLLDVAACWGFEFDASLVGEALGLRRLPVLQAFAKLEARDRLVRSEGRSFVFDHNQVQEVLYDALPEMLREEYHLALAEALESRGGKADGITALRLCSHFQLGGDERRALPYLDEAITHLRKGHRDGQAADLATRVLAVPGLLEGEKRADLLLRLAGPTGVFDSLSRVEEWHALAEELSQLAEELDDDVWRGRAERSVGLVLHRRSRPDDAEAHFRRALELAERTGDRNVRAGALGDLGNVHHTRGELDEATRRHEMHLEASRASGDRRSEAVALVNLALVLQGQGRLTECIELNQQAAAVAAEIGDRDIVSTTDAHLGNVYVTLGRLDEARARLERHLRFTREMGMRTHEARALGNLGNVCYGEGRLVDALQCFDRFLALSREVGDRRSAAIALVNIGPAWLALGQTERAREALEESLTICRDVGLPYPEGYALQNLAELCDDAGDEQEALDRTREALELRRRIGHRDGVADSLVVLGDLLRRAGDADGARAALDEAAEICREQERTGRLALTLATKALLPGESPDEALRAMEAAADEGSTARTCLYLYLATGDAQHLERAKQTLDDTIARAPEEHHDAMRSRSRTNRDILAAWREHAGGTDDDSDDDVISEAETRVG